ncbi:alpha/beta fold hydrolase, partial [Streptomyces sp. SM12]|uniref:alpha/beta hydrolase n=2 Tax=unclassified Streptomyces TaxID=2593676 RepID=UPI001C67D5C9
PASPPHGGETGAGAAEAAGTAQRVELRDGDVRIGALLALPTTEPRALVVAIHGRAMSPGYFDGPVDPRGSLLADGAALGYAVLAVERPGYGTSAGSLPHGLPLAGQARTLRRALRGLTAATAVGAGVLLLGHSDGGKVAIHLAGEDWDGRRPGDRLLGLDVNGCGRHYARAALHFPDTLAGGASSLNWGPLRLYPRGTFQASRALMRPVPVREEAETPHWPVEFPGAAARVRCPVRLTFGEQERWWELGSRELSATAAAFTSAPARIDRVAEAGHNLSLGHAARLYHLRALAFLEECLTGRATGHG